MQEECEFGLLVVVQHYSELLFLMSSCIKRIILPIATNIPSIKTRMSNMVNGFVAQCEISLNVIQRYVRPFRVKLRSQSEAKEEGF